MASFSSIASLWIVVLALAACSTAGPTPHFIAATRATAPSGWIYDVTATARAETLEVEALFHSMLQPHLVIEDGAESFVRDLLIEDHGAWRSLELSDDAAGWEVPECVGHPCRIRYRFLLVEAARKIDQTMYAFEHDGAIVAPPSTWLIHPTFVSVDDWYRFQVSTPPDVAFTSGVSRTAPDVYEAPAGALPKAPYAVFGKMRRRILDEGHGTVELVMLGGPFDAGDDAAVAWARIAAHNVSGYYGRFPVDRVLVIVVPSWGRGLNHAMTLGNGGASIIASAGRATMASVFADDWQMTHEMVHLAFPNMARPHRWLEEGIATYVEPIARTRAGIVTKERLWRDLVLGLPHGLPEAGDRGLDRTHTWGRTYWGGALFCFLADLEIRKRTDNRRSFDDALRGILDAGGDIRVTWTIDRALEAGDRAVGLSVLSELYARMGSEPMDVDLSAIWQSLGVLMRGSTVTFDDSAPLAAIRNAIAEPTATATR